MKQIRNLVLPILILFLSCAEGNKNAKSISVAHKEMVAPTEAPTRNNISIDRKLIKEGNIEFETKDLDVTRKMIFEAVKKYNAYVASDVTYKSSVRNSNTIKIRVPAKNFDKLLNDTTKGVENFDRKDINVKDVTEEFVDIQARLKTKKELEQRYLDLLKQAKNVTEILEIEKQIGLLRSEIESIEGRLKYLQNQISFSTLTISIYENNPQTTKFGHKFKNGFKNGWNNLIRFFVFLINIWPFILISIGLIFGYKKYRRRKKKKLQG